MFLLSDPKYKVEAAVIKDAVDFENATEIFHDERGCIIKCGHVYKCVFADINDFGEYVDKYKISDSVCILGAPNDAPDILGASANRCFTYAYLAPMPPAFSLPNGVEIKRLAPSLAGTILDIYHNPGDYTVERIQTLMREKGIFGAISDGALAGFIGRHRDGSMGMLEVFPNYRRSGLAYALESFLITLVMTYGRIPICDVFTSNAASIALQEKLGLARGAGTTFWGKV